MISSAVNLKQLEAFVAVVDLGTFRNAARHLNTTQPNISSRIAKLESNLGVVLLHRDAGSVRLTEKGAALLISARDVLWATEALIEKANRTDLIEDKLRLGVTELVACTWLHEYLRQLHDAYPAVSVELTVNLSREIDKDLAEGQLDLAVQTAPFSTNLSEVRALGGYPYQWVAAPEIAQDLQEGESLARMSVFSFLTHVRHTSAPTALSERLRKEGLTTARVVHNSSLTSCMQMAIDRMGVALLPAALVAEDVAAGRLHVVACNWHPEPLEFYVRYDRKRVPRYVRAAADLAIEVCKADAGSP